MLDYWVPAPVDQFNIPIKRKLTANQLINSYLEPPPQPLRPGSKEPRPATELDTPDAELVTRLLANIALHDLSARRSGKVEFLVADLDIFLKTAELIFGDRSIRRLDGDSGNLVFRSNLQ